MSEKVKKEEPLKREPEKRVLKSVTYGVRGLMEWHIALPTGSPLKPFVTVNFEGGQITGYGVAPARFTTIDPFVQELIEKSPYFKGNRIFKISEKTLGR